MSLRKAQPHHATTTAHDGRQWIYTHSIGEYLADEKKTYSQQRYIYVFTDQELERLKVQEEAAADARYALRAFEYYD